MTTDCLFCNIIAGEIPSAIVHRDEHTVAIRDIQPQAPIHLLVMPARHISGVSDAGPGDSQLLGDLLLAAKQVAQQEGLSAFRLVVNNGAEAGQSVFHLHIHVLGGRAMRWPPG